MEKDYSKNIVKDYQYWTVYVHENQGYLGRCVVWCKREGALDLNDVTDEEWAELRMILKQLRTASKKCFAPDWLNYAFLGNEMRHLHGHFIPRYATSKIFMKTTFKDALYGTNFNTDHTFVTPETVLQGVKDKLKEALNEDAAV